MTRPPAVLPRRHTAEGGRANRLGQTNSLAGRVHPDLAEAWRALAVQSDMDVVRAAVADRQAELAVQAEMDAVPAEVAVGQAELTAQTKVARVQAELVVRTEVEAVPAEVAAVQFDLASGPAVEVLATLAASSARHVGRRREPGSSQREQRREPGSSHREQRRELGGFQREQPGEPGNSQREQRREACARLPMWTRCPPSVPAPVHCRLQQIFHSAPVLRPDPPTQQRRFAVGRGRARVRNVGWGAPLGPALHICAGPPCSWDL